MGEGKNVRGNRIRRRRKREEKDTGKIRISNERNENRKIKNGRAER